MTSWRLLRNSSHLPKLSQWFEGWCCYRHHLKARHLHSWVPSRDGRISSVAGSLEVMWRLREGQKARNFGMYHRKTHHTPYCYTRCVRVLPLSDHQEDRSGLSLDWISQLTLDFPLCILPRLEILKLNMLLLVYKRRMLKCKNCISTPK